MEYGGFSAFVADSKIIFERDDDVPSPHSPHGLTTSQLKTLKLVSLSVACISISSALVAFYWFVRIRRSFRHEYAFGPICQYPASR